LNQKNTFKSFGNNWVAFAFLILGLGLTFAATFFTKKNIESRAKAEFALVCNEIEIKIETRLHAHAQLLRTGAAFFAASDTVTRNQWLEFINQAKIEKNLPGIQGVGFSLVIPKNGLQQHIQKIQDEGFRDYTVKPAGEREIYTSIIYLEPFTGRNLRAFGYDMFTEPVRRKAMEQARDNDVAMLSGKVLLVQETKEDVQPGSLMYVPVFRNGMPVNTVEQRRTAIMGWVYSPYRMDDLMQGMLGRWDLLQIERIHLQVYDDSISTNSILFDSQKKETAQHSDSPSRMLCVPIDFNGKMWTLCFSQSDEQVTFFDCNVYLVFGGGILISFLVFVLFLILTSRKSKALKIAKKLTAELKLSETKFKTVADYTYECEYWEGSDGRLIYISPSCERISGYKPDEFLADKNLLLNIVHPEDQKILDAHFEKVHSPEKNHDINEIDFRIIKKDGSIAIIGHVCTPVFDENGNYLGRRISNRDITERKHAEELLQQTRLNFETFFNTIDDFLFVLDDHGNIIQVNNTVINRLGYSWEELSGQSVLMVHPPERREEAGRIVGEMLQGHSEFCPVPVLTKSGVQIPVETRVSHGIWDGKPVIFGVTKDISKVKLSEEKFSKLFHLNPSACGLNDLETLKYVEVNEAFYTLLGFDKDEVIGKTAIELGILPVEARNSIMIKANTNGIIINAEAALIAKNGDIKQVLLSAENIYVQDKEFRFTVVQDVTARKLAENAVQISETRYRRLFETTKDGILILDAESGMIKDVNPFLIEMLGYSKEEFIEKAIWEIGFFGDLVANKDKFIELQQDEYVRYENLPLETAYGKTINVEFVSNVYLVDDRKVIQCNIRDITERRIADEALKKSEEALQKLNATKDKFFSIIAHDLKSPFNSIMGFSELLVEQVKNKDYNGIEKFAGIILNSSQRAVDLLMNLMEWSRSQTGRMEFIPEYFELVDFMGEILFMFDDIAGQKSIIIKKNLPSKIPVFADKAMINTVIRNLVSNAIKFTNPGGEIIITATEKQNEILVSVKDNGVGIPHSAVDKLFRIDENYTTSGTNKEQGTGLGLILCKEFIEKHGGKIWVESEEGKGSMFSFIIPTGK